ncbi:MAG: alpha/beta hydrolase [Myxococcota bacterium]|nr:alpha/beta hydrolase [Myxococcota bacterium]
MKTDPGHFDPASIHPDTLALNRTVEEALAAAPPITSLEPSVIRAARASGGTVWGPLVQLDHAEDREIPGPAGPIPLRVFRPETARGVFLHIHGGGWTLGAADQQDEALDALSRALSVAVVSVGYRLAPEHPHPAGADDCEAAALWLARNARAEFGSETLLIGGESAGAHLSVVTLLRLHDRHGKTPFRAANLFYGCYDLGLTPSVRAWGERNLILSTPIIEWFADHFVPDRAARGDPDVSPLYADLGGLPPALFTVGTWDPLVDDSLFMAARWEAAGGVARLAVEPGAIHAFNAFPTEQARRANERAHSFLSGALEER